MRDKTRRSPDRIGDLLFYIFSESFQPDTVYCHIFEIARGSIVG